MPWFFPAAVFVFGACVGSFLNVCIYRIPAGRSVVRPGSHCACGKPIAWYDNIPIFSWFILRGRARCCGAKYSFRYAAIEALTAGLFLACWFCFPVAKAFCLMLFVSALVCATFIDFDHMEIPDVFTIGLAVAGVVLSCAFPVLHGQTHNTFAVAAVRSGIMSVQGVLIGSALILWIALLAEAVLKKDAMGFGDVKFLGAIGAFCGWQGAVVAIFGGALLGVAGLTLRFVFGKIFPQKTEAQTDGAEGNSEDQPGLSMQSHVPFGPMLAGGALLYLFFLQPWVDEAFGEIIGMIWAG